MKKVLCRINMTVTDLGESTMAKGSVELDCDADDMVEVLAQMFTAFKLSPADVLRLTVRAVESMLQEEAKIE